MGRGTTADWLNQLGRMIDVIQERPIRYSEWRKKSNMERNGRFQPYVDFLSKHNIVEKVHNSSLYRWKKEYTEIKQFSDKELKAHHLDLVKSVEDCLEGKVNVNPTEETMAIMRLSLILIHFQNRDFGDAFQILNDDQIQLLKVLQILVSDKDKINCFMQHLKDYPKTYNHFSNSCSLIDLGKRYFKMSEQLRREEYFIELTKVLAHGIVRGLELIILEYLLVPNYLIEKDNIILIEENQIIQFQEYSQVGEKLTQIVDLICTKQKDDQNEDEMRKKILGNLEEFIIAVEKNYKEKFIDIFEECMKSMDDVTLLVKNVQKIVRMSQNRPLRGVCSECLLEDDDSL